MKDVIASASAVADRRVGVGVAEPDAALPWAIANAAVQPARQPRRPRIRTVVGGSDALHRLAAVVQFTYRAFRASTMATRSA